MQEDTFYLVEKIDEKRFVSILMYTHAHLEISEGRFVRRNGLFSIEC